MIFDESPVISSVSLPISASACISGSQSISKASCFCLIRNATERIKPGLLDIAFGTNYHIVRLFLQVAPLELKFSVIVQHFYSRVDTPQRIYSLAIALVPSIFYSHSGLSLFGYKLYLFLGSTRIFNGDETS